MDLIVSFPEFTYFFHLLRQLKFLRCEDALGESNKTVIICIFI